MLATGSAVGTASSTAGEQRHGAIGSVQLNGGLPDNGTDRPLHEHPDRASGDGETGALADRLADDLGRRLENSSVEISEGEYERGSELLGEEYQTSLEQYLEVAGDADGESGTGNETTSETFAKTATRQRNLSRTLVRFNETRDAYRRARDRGDEARARELARTLLDLADRIEALGRDLELRYEQLAEFAGANVTAQRTSVNQEVNETAGATERVAREAFVATTLTASTEDERVSYTDPLDVEGRLVDEEGDPIANARIVVPDPAAPATTRTDEQGRFSLSYRPVGRPLAADSVPVQYRPEPTAPYQAAERSFAVALAQVQATLSIERTRDAVALGDQLTTTARVTVDDTPASDVPLRLALGGIRARTDSSDDGTATFAPTVTAAVPTGDQLLRVTMPMANRSVTITDATRRVSVQSTPVALTVDATPVDAAGAVAAGDDVTELEPEGRLTTDGGEPVANQSVDILIDDELVATTTTDDSGRFATTVDAGTYRGTIAVEASYADATTNLESTNTRTTVDLAASDGTDGRTLAGILGGLAVLVCGSAVAYWQGWGPFSDPSEEGDEGRAEGTSPGGPDEPDPDPAVLAAARDRLDAAPDEATTLAYGTVRHALSEQVDATDGATHWEFYRTCAADGLTDEQVDALERVTERYETAAFSPAGVDPDGARDALQAADTLAAE